MTKLLHTFDNMISPVKYLTGYCSITKLISEENNPINYTKYLRRILPVLVLFFTTTFSIFSQDSYFLWKENYSKSGMCSRDMAVNSVLSGDSLLFVTGYTERNLSNFDVTTFAFNHSADTLWKRTFSTYKNDYSFDKPQRIITNNSGDVFVMGNRNINYSNQALFIIKYDKNGKILWSDVSSWIEINGMTTTLVGYDIVADNNDNVYLLARYADDQAGLNTVVVKYDKAGKKSWTRNYNYSYPLFANMDHNQKILLVINTGYNGEYQVSKLDTAGMVIWERTLKSDGDGSLKTIIDACFDKNNNLYLMVDAWPSIYHFAEYQDVLLYKITEQGDIAWKNSYNGQANNYDHGIMINLVRDSLIFMGMSTKTINNELDAILLEFNSEGKRIDSLTMRGESLNNDYLVSMTTDRNINTYAVLLSYINASEYQVLTLKIDSNMVVKWKSMHPSAADAIYYPQKIFLTDNNNLLLVGNNNSTTNPSLSYYTDIDYSITQIDTSGILKKEFVYSDPGTSNFRLARMELDSDNNIYVSGYSQIGPDWENFINYFNYNYYIIKYNESGELLWSASLGNDTLNKWTYVTQLKSDSIITIIGNGYSENSNRKYTILYSFNLKGELVRSKTIDNNGYYCSNGISDENGNIYLYIPRYDNTYSSIMKLNSGLDIKWDYHLKEISQLEEIPAIHVASDGKVYFAGKDHKLEVINNGVFYKEINLDYLFSGFIGMHIDSASNIYIAGVLTDNSNKASFAKIDSSGIVIWHITDSRMQSVRKLIYQGKSKSFVIVGTECSIVGCKPSIIKRFSIEGEILDSLALEKIYPREVISDRDDFLYIANSSDSFVMVSPKLDSLYQNTRFNDSIYYNYVLSDIKTDANQNIYISGTFGNEVYLHSNEWNAITTLKFKKPNIRPFIRNLQKYYRIMPQDTLRVNLIINDYENDPCTLSFPDNLDWITFDPSKSQIVFTPDSNDLGINSIKVNIKDAVGNSNIYFLEVKVGNTAPIFITEPTLSINVEDNYYYKPIAEDADNDSLFFDLDEGPAWLNITTQGILSGMPGSNDTCTCHVSLIVRDQFGGEDVQDFDIRVILPTSIDDIYSSMEENKYLIFPNPSDEILYITPLEEINKEITISVLEIHGGTIFTVSHLLPFKGENIPIVIKAYKPGIYYLIVNEPDKTYSYKVIKK